MTALTIRQRVVCAVLERLPEGSHGSVMFDVCKRDGQWRVMALWTVPPGCGSHIVMGREVGTGATVDEAERVLLCRLWRLPLARLAS